MAGSNGKPNDDSKRGAQGVDDEYGPEADGFSSSAASEATDPRRAQIVNAVKTAEDSAALVRAGHVDAGHLPRDNPDALCDADHEDQREDHLNQGMLAAIARRCSQGRAGDQRRARAQAVEHHAADRKTDESSKPRSRNNLRGGAGGNFKRHR